MSSDPIDTPEVPTTAPAPVADYVAANRGPVAIALIAVGIACLALGGYYLAKGFNAPKAEKKADAADAAPPRNPKEAATALEQVFEPAPPEDRQAAASASEALRGGDYEKAVVHLEAMKLRPNITVDQGLAIHHSLVAMESKLVQAMEAGDPNARRAYETLKRMKRQ